MTTTTYVGTAGSDTFHVDPMSGGYVITTGGGADDIVLDPGSGTFQPAGVIHVTDFQPGPNGDHLDLLAFLRSLPFGSGPVNSDPFVGPNLRLLQNGADTVVQVNPSGAWSDLVILTGVDPHTLTWANFPDLQPATGNIVNDYPNALPRLTNDPAQVIGSASHTGLNLVGTNGDDIIVGGFASDTFHGGGGSDRIFGGGGSTDAATYDGAIRQYAFMEGWNTEMVVPGYIYQVKGGPEGATDTLVDIQRIQFVDGYLATSPYDTAGQVYRLYEATLNRAPDPVGLANWVHALNSGASLQTVVNGFVNSTEFQQTYGSLTDTQFVTLLYNNVLHRAPDNGGLTNWLNYLAAGHTRAEVVTGFSESAEDIDTLAAPVQQGLWIQDAAAAETYRLYDAVFSRLPDVSGLTNWTHMLESGTSLQTVAAGFVGSTEFQANYGNLDNAGFVNLLYQNVLHRSADTAGLNNWLSYLGQGHSRAELVLGFSESPEHIANTAAHVDQGIWLAG